MKFIEVTELYSEKFMISLSAIKCIFQQDGNTLLYTTTNDRLPVEESYEEVKRLIELAGK